ncbi:NEL-type E3 ubiquitin ligase domain-containing protein [Pseudomonas syringae]
MPDPVSVPAQLPPALLSSTLLELTGDLDKADVLQQRIPRWLFEAKPELLEQLEKVSELAGLQEPRVNAILQRIKGLDQFCAEELTRGLQRQFGVTLNVKRDHLWLPWDVLDSGIAMFGVPTTKVVIETRTLLESAMLNFSEDEAQGRRFPRGSQIRRDTDTVVSRISVTAFATYCRSLDLGRRYQEHLRGAINQAVPLADEVLYNADAGEIKHLKVYDMATDVYLAYLRGDIAEPAFKLLLGFTRQGSSLSKAAVLAEAYDGKPLMWQGLDVHDSCLWGIVVFSQEAIDNNPQTRCIVYMPGEPYRPIFEYPTFAAFQTYLTLKLQVKSYADFFARYLDEESRGDFFKRFSVGKSLGLIKPIAIDVGLFQFFFNSLIGKLQKDSRVLAVPTADFDQAVREQRWRDYESWGLDLLNLAGFFVPVIGQLMLGVAVGQMLGEIYEGVQDWRHEDRSAAFAHLCNVLENVASMAAFVAGGKVVGSLRRVARRNLELIDNFEAVDASDGTRRLWRTSLKPYEQPLTATEPDAQGVYWRDGQPWARIDGRGHALRFDASLGQWRIRHPRRPDAHAPPVLHNGAGGWRGQHERPQEWSNTLYGLRRLDPRLEALSDNRLEHICQASDVQLPQVQRWAEGNLKLPASFVDSIQRFALNQKITDLIARLEQRQPYTAEDIALQLQALPLMPEWPSGRYLEVLPAEGNASTKYPSNARTDDELSVVISRDQLEEGEVLLGVADGLYRAELDTLLGDTPVRAGETNAEALARRLAHSLKVDRKPLFQKLYADYDQPVGAEQSRLVESVPGLPASIAAELIDSTASIDRIHLRDERRVPLSLGQAAREAVAQVQRERLMASFHMPELADRQAHRFSWRLLRDLPGFPDALQLQLRETSASGAVLERIGDSAAAQTRVVVKTGERYQAFEADGRSLGEQFSGPQAFYRATLQTLPVEMRTGLDISGSAASDAQRLRYHLLDRAVAVRAKIPEERVALTSACQVIDAPPPAVPTRAQRGLMRKITNLYPFFSESQARETVMSLGVDDPSRALAVRQRERQLARLDGVLRAWIQQDDDMRKLPGRLEDYQLSRRQVAARLRSAWRHQIRLPDETRAQVYGLSLDGMRVGKLPTLPIDIDLGHVQRLSLKNMALDNDVAYFLKAFKGLRSLELDKNQLTWLPEVLSHMPSLQRLSLAQNSLNLTDATTKKLQAMSGLRALDLSSNPLGETPSVEQMDQLQSLNLRNTRARELPEGLLTRLHLEDANLRENDIVELPSQLFSAPVAVTEKINLRLNPISHQSRLDLDEYRRRTGVGMGLQDDDIALLSEQRSRQAWLEGKTAADYRAREATWERLKDDWQSGDFFAVLRQMVNTPQYKQVRADLVRRVWQVIDAAAEDRDLRGLLFNLASGEPNCVDAAAYSFSEMEVTVMLNKAMNEAGALTPSVPTLLKLGRGLFRLEQLDSISDIFSRRKNIADELAVRLVYRSALAKPLDLPGQPDTIAYREIGGVTQEDLTEAMNQVSTREMTSDLLRFMTRQGFWQEYLKRQFAAEFSRIGQVYDRQIKAMDVTSSAYLSQALKVQNDHHQAREQLVDRLTRKAIEQADNLEPGQCPL